jgi:DNA-directed RNA polymerase subunit RPC12/RpoP|nr:MAG TPA: Thaumarchaeal output domain 1 [Caudoviricetes sp.]
MAEYIDRDAIYKAFANAGTDVLERASEIEYIAGFSYELVIEILDNIPTVNVAPIKNGQWEWFDEDIGTPITGHEREWGWRCSRCKHELPDDYDDPDYRPMLDYCPYCGAKMDGGANNG